METTGLSDLEKLFNVQLTAIHQELEALRILKTHEISGVEARLTTAIATVSTLLDRSDELSDRRHDRLYDRCGALEAGAANLAGKLWAFGVAFSALNVIVSLLLSSGVLHLTGK